MVKSSEDPSSDAFARSFLEAVNQSLESLSRPHNPAGLSCYSNFAAAPLVELLSNDDMCQARRVHLAIDTGTCTHVPHRNASLESGDAEHTCNTACVRFEIAQ